MPSKTSAQPPIKKRRLMWLVLALGGFLLFLLVQLPISWLLAQPEATARVTLVQATGNVLAGDGVWQWRTASGEALTGQLKWRLSIKGLLTGKPYQVTVSQGTSQLSGQLSLSHSGATLYDWTGRIKPESLYAATGLMVDMPVQLNTLSGQVGDTLVLTGQANMAPAQFGYHLHGITGHIGMPALQADIAPTENADGTLIRVMSPSGQVAMVTLIDGQIETGLTYRLLKDITGLGLGLASDDAIMMQLTR